MHGQESNKEAQTSMESKRPTISTKFHHHIIVNDIP